MKLFDPYMPAPDGNLLVWLGTYKEKLGQLAATIGLSQADVQEQQDAAQAMIDSIVKTDLKKAELKEAVSLKHLFRRTKLRQIRNMASHIKTLKSYRSNIGKELGIVMIGLPVEFRNLKPVLSAVSFPGQVLVHFKKQRMTAVSMYTRLKDQQEWVSLGISKTSPVVDDRPLLEPGKPEAREYRAICFDGQDEVGHFSDPIAIVYGG